jgi:hypothetical protein
MSIQTPTENEFEAWWRKTGSGIWLDSAEPATYAVKAVSESAWAVARQGALEHGKRLEAAARRVYRAEREKSTLTEWEAAFAELGAALESQS